MTGPRVNAWRRSCPLLDPRCQHPERVDHDKEQREGTDACERRPHALARLRLLAVLVVLVVLVVVIVDDAIDEQFGDVIAIRLRRIR